MDIKLLPEIYRSKRNEKLSCNKMRELQMRLLSKLLTYAYENSAYYRKSFTEAGITSENILKLPISAFPTIDKSILIDNFDSIVTERDLTQKELAEFDKNTDLTERLFKGKYHIVHSSGSTGEPKYFAYDTRAWNAMLAGMIRAALWGMSIPQIIKFLAKRPRILYVAATDGRYGGAMAVGDGIQGCGAKQMFLDVNTPLCEWIDRIQSFQPNMIVGYPSAVKIAAELASEGKISVNAERIVSCGEPLGAGLREYIHKAFGAEVINFYGASESIALGVEDEKSDGMYLFDDMNLIEVKNGNMYLTVLYNYAQPLIRYRLSDKLVLKSPDTRYPFTRSESIAGRDEDIMWFDDGCGGREFLHPLAVEGFCIDGLLDYQFRKISGCAFDILAEVSDSTKREGVKAELLKQVRVILDKKRLAHIRFDVKFTDSIMPDPKTGKKALVIQGV